MDLLQREGCVLRSTFPAPSLEPDLSARHLVTPLFRKYPVPPQASPILGVEFSGIVEDAGRTGGKWTDGTEVFGLAYGVSFSFLACCAAGTLSG